MCNFEALTLCVPQQYSHIHGYYNINNNNLCNNIYFRNNITYIHVFSYTNSMVAIFCQNVCRYVLYWDPKPSNIVKIKRIALAENGVHFLVDIPAPKVFHANTWIKEIIGELNDRTYRSWISLRTWTSHWSALNWVHQFSPNVTTTHSYQIKIEKNTTEVRWWEKHTSLNIKLE